ncbi:MAG: hypothetical protein HC789_12395 [Microcoleus sp. CSU_2_2]|nr:hypothetical protein [Microcoleus sp. CSU_2_2]
MTNDYCFPANGRAGTGAPPLPTGGRGDTAPTNGRAGTHRHRPYQLPTD